jgi:hypothetical protein
MIEDDKRPRRQDFSSLDKHRRQGKTFTPPLMQVPGVELLSWRNERLPEVLWATLLARGLSRDQYIHHLSLIAKAAMVFRDENEVCPEHCPHCIDTIVATR